MHGVQQDEQLMCNEEEKAHLHLAAVFLEAWKVDMNSQTSSGDLSMSTAIVVFGPIHQSCLCNN